MSIAGLGCSYMSIAAGCLHMGLAGSQSAAGAEVHDFFGQGEDARFAGNYQEAVGGIAAEPTRPLQSTRIHGAIEAVPS
jgi:hypothetical protein